jgi:hypothetical protein
MSNTTGASVGTGTANSSGASDLSPDFYWASGCLNVSFLCSFLLTIVCLFALLIVVIALLVLLRNTASNSTFVFSSYSYTRFSYQKHVSIYEIKQQFFTFKKEERDEVKQHFNIMNIYIYICYNLHNTIIQVITCPIIAMQDITCTIVIENTS